MPHSYSSCLIHYIFSTKDRRKFILPAWRDRLWAYVGGIARENAIKALAVGGTDDHAHVLASLPSTLSVAKAIQLLKGGSSKWVHDSFPEARAFAWQEGYGAFSIGISAIHDTIAYIGQQVEHHSTKTFEEEFIAFLERHRIEYDPRYVFG
jgi:REP element-mobilizing transposase RayT